MASKAGPVEIVVDIVGNFRDELQEIERKLDKLDLKSVDVGFGIASEEEIQEVEAQLKQLKDSIETTLDIDTRGHAKAQAIKTALAKDMSSTLHIDTDKRRGNFPGMPPPISGDQLQAVDEATRASIQRAMPREVGGARFSIFDRDKFPMADLGLDPDAVWPDFDPGGGVPGREGGGIRFGFGDGPDDVTRMLNRLAKNSRERLGKLGRTLNKLRPNIMMVWNALAALIPVFVTLGAAAIGLAGGMIAIATAGAAILGLGLLGWGDSFSESMQNLKKEAKALGSELFDVVQPLARVAQPIMQDWMEGAPRQVQKLVDPLRDMMTAFDDTLGQIGGGIVDWIARVVKRMTAMEGIISQIVLRFGSIAGDFLIDFMTNMVRFAYENQDALIAMAGALRSVGAIVLKLSIFIVRILTVLTPLIDLLNWAASILSNRWVAGIATTLIMLYALSAAVTTLTAAIAAQNGFLLANIAAWGWKYVSAVISAMQAIKGAIALIWSANSALGVMAGLLAAVTFGLSLLGGLAAAGVIGEGIGGFGGTGGGGGGQSQQEVGGTTINIQGNVEKKQMDRLLDEVPKESRRESHINSEMNRNG